MSLYNYMIFNEIVKYRSFNKAANALHISPSAVSHAISKLESEVGFNLLVRSKGGIKPTNDGMEIIPCVSDLLECNKRLENKLSEINGLHSGMLRVGIANNAGFEWANTIIDSFHKKHPDVIVTVEQTGYNNVMSSIRNGTADIAFTSHYFKSSTIDMDDIVEVHIYQEEMLKIKPPGNKTDNITSISHGRRNIEPVIMTRTGYETEISAIVEHNGLLESTNYLMDNYDAVIAMVEKGKGIGIVPKSALDRGELQVQAESFSPKEYRVIKAITSSNEMSPAAVAMMRDIKAAITNDRDDCREDIRLF